ncbi:hypothetical protein D3C76_1402280 [compost metagenome]
MSWLAKSLALTFVRDCPCAVKSCPCWLTWLPSACTVEASAFFATLSFSDTMAELCELSC